MLIRLVMLILKNIRSLIIYIRVFVCKYNMLTVTIYQLDDFNFKKITHLHFSPHLFNSINININSVPFLLILVQTTT